MEEKKIKDMTGNREEKIASKKPVREGAVKEAPRAPKRPFVRVSQTGADMTEKISAKKPEAAQQAEQKSADRQGNRSGGKHPQDRREPRDTRNRRGERRAEPKSAVQAAEEPSASPEVRTEKRRDSRRGEKRAENRQSEKRERREPQQNAGERRGKQRANEAHGDRRDLRKNVSEKAEPSAEPRRHEETVTEEQLRADGLLFMLDEEPRTETVPQPEPEIRERTEVVGIRFRGTGKTYYFAPNGIVFRSGEHAIVETVRGMEYGDVMMGNCMVNSEDVVQPLKPVLRKATPEDDAHYRANRELEEKAKPVFFEKVKKNKLEMQLVDVEYTFDNSKLCFYFTADGRVDFRELVKDLASVFRTRIELRQIGVRDEARLFGGLGICGRPFCCKSFLADFAQVSIKMAKEQNLSLASAKISGSCGRLMCCLRYEQDTYERESAALPRVNSIVETPKGRATVLESNFLTGQIKVSDAGDGSIRYFTPEEVHVIAPPPRKAAAEETDEAESAEIAALTKD